MTRIVVVGAGIVGLSTAYYARQAGAEVTVLDRRGVGAGASTGNAGWVVPSLAAPLPEPGMARLALRSLLSREGAFRLPPSQAVSALPWLWRFHRFCTSANNERGLHAIASLARTSLHLYEQMSADGVSFHLADTGLLYVAHTRKKADAARRGLEPLASYGIEATQLCTGENLRHLEPSLTGTGLSGFLVAADRSVDPTSLLDGLARRLDSMGVPIRADIEATGLHLAGDRVQAVATDSGPYPADIVVIAAGAASGQLAKRCGLRLPMRAGTGYSFSVSPATAPIRPLYLLEAKAAITPLPGRVRVTGGFDLTAVNPALNPSRTQSIAAAASTYASWTDGPRRQEWVGSRPMLPDGLLAIGPVPGIDGLHINSGHAMLGVTLAAASSKALIDSISGHLTYGVLAPFATDRFDRSRPGRARRKRGARAGSDSGVDGTNQTRRWTTEGLSTATHRDPSVDSLLHPAGD